MSDRDDDAAGSGPKRSGSAARSDRLGELLPEGTRDESATGWGDQDDADSDDEHLRREVPPHHG